MLELMLLDPDAPGEPTHGWLKCACVRGRRSIVGFACACGCHGVGGMAIGGMPLRDENVVRLTRKLGA